MALVPVNNRRKHGEALLACQRFISARGRVPSRSLRATGPAIAGPVSLIHPLYPRAQNGNKWPSGCPVFAFFSLPRGVRRLWKNFSKIGEIRDSLRSEVINAYIV